MFRYNPDNKVILILTKCADMLLATFFWLLLCVPVLTAGAATSALYTLVWRIYDGQDVRVTREFFSAFRKNFWVSTGAWVLTLVTGMILCANMYACRLMDGSAGLYGIMKGSTVCFALVFSGGVTFLFPGIARYKVTVCQALKNSVLFAFRYWKVTAGALVLVVCSGLLLYFLEWYSIVLLAPNVYLHGVLLDRSFQEYERCAFAQALPE